MPHLPLVSVIIPCFNKDRLVEDAVACVKKSSYSPVEILVINDGSTDPLTLESLALLKQDSAVRVIDQKNQGLSAARNTGVDAAAGDYIFYLDHDDMISLHYLENAVGYLEGHPETAFVYPDIIFFSEVFHLKRTRDYDPEVLAVNNYIPCSCLHRAAIVKTLRFDTSLKALEDWDYLLQLRAKGHRGFKLGDNYLYYRIIKSLSMTQQNSQLKLRSGIISRIRAKYGLHLTPKQNASYWTFMALAPVLTRLVRAKEERALRHLLAHDSALKSELADLNILPHV